MTRSSQAPITPAPANRTFYRRPLPDTCTALSSSKGQKMFASAMIGNNHNGLKSFFQLMEQLSTQSEPAYCGVTTLVIVLNALSVDPRRVWKGPWRWYEESMLNCCMDMEEIKNTGITLGVFVCLAKCQGLAVDATLASDSSRDEFRQAVRLACVKNMDDEAGEVQGEEISSRHTFLVVSYSRAVLKQTGAGHFSPVAAYDEASDSVLILDTARFKYGPHWVSLENLFNAMLPIDPDSQKSRGFLLLSFDEDSYNTNTTNMPVSVLLRSKHLKIPARREYREYLDRASKEGAILIEHVERFWTKDGQDLQFVWKMAEPQLTPVHANEVEALGNLKVFLQNLIKSIRWDRKAYQTSTISKSLCCQSSCSSKRPRTVLVTVEEAIFIIYLASLSHEKRQELIFNPVLETVGSKPEALQITREQLMAESELVQYAIEFSNLSEEESLENMAKNVTVNKNKSMIECTGCNKKC